MNVFLLLSLIFDFIKIQGRLGFERLRVNGREVVKEGSRKWLLGGFKFDIGSENWVVGTTQFVCVSWSYLIGTQETVRLHGKSLHAFALQLELPAAG